MKNQFRSLSPDFLDHLNHFDVRLDATAMRTWLRTHNESGFRNDVLCSLREGKPIDPRYIAKLVRYFRAERDPHSPFRRLNDAFDSYARRNGIDDPGKAHFSRLIECVSIPGDGTLLDSFMEGIELIRDIFEHVRKPASCVSFLGGPNDVRDAIRWMYIEAGRMMSHENIPGDKAQEIGAQRIGIPLDDYQERAIGWWHARRWTIIYTSGFRVPIGMSIALPLNPEAYEAVRTGRLKSYDCTPADFRCPSPQLLIEGVAPRPIDEGPEAGGSNLRIVAAMACQQAHLTDLPSVAIKTPLQLLTFEGTPEQARRAARFGYVPTGYTMPDTNIKTIERTLFMPTKRGISEWCIWGAWKGLQKATRDLDKRTNNGHG